MEIIKNTILIKYPMIFKKKMKDSISYFEWNILSELVVQANHIVDTFNMWDAAFINVQEHINDEDIHVSPLDKEKWDGMLPIDGSEPMEGDLNLGGYDIDVVNKIWFEQGGFIGNLDGNDFTISLPNGEVFRFDQDGLDLNHNKISGLANGTEPTDGVNIQNLIDYTYSKAEINSKDETKLSKSLTSLVTENELSLSDVLVIDKGSGARRITLSILAGYLATVNVELFTIVEELPTENQNPNTIYLLATENEDGENQLLEYIWIANESRWELVGSLEVDLSDYYTKEEADILFNSKLFETTYGTTTYEQITTALSENKIPVCYFNNLWHVYVGQFGAGSDYLLCTTYPDSVRTVRVTPSNTYTSTKTDFETTSNKQTSMPSSPTNTQYLSALAVKNYVDGIIPDTSGFITKPISDKGETTNKTLSYAGTFKVLYLGTDGAFVERTMTMPTAPTVPTISTDIEADATSDTKTASPKAVKDYVDNIVGDIGNALDAILGV